MSGTEQRGVCAGGKKPTARSIKQDFETFLNVSKSAQRGENTFFGTLRGGAKGRRRDERESEQETKGWTECTCTYNLQSPAYPWACCMH